MSLVQLPDELKQLIDRQVAQGRPASNAEFLAEAVLRYADELDSHDEAAAAAREGIADIEAGR